MNQYVIHLLLNKEEVRIVPSCHQQPNVFSLYQEACRRAGAKFYLKTYTIPYTQVNQIIDSLRQFGFQPNISPQLHNRLTTKPAPLNWIQEIQADLQTRGLQLRKYQEEAVSILSSNKSFLLLDMPGVGKQQPVDSLVLTPDGWRKIGSLSIGDKVIGKNGTAYNVTGIFPQGFIENFKITFSDGASVECGDNHLWTVEYNRGGKKKVNITLPLKPIREGAVLKPGEYGRISRSLTLDLSKTTLKFPTLSAPVQFNNISKLPIDPYLLGALIANGYLGGNSTALTVNSNDTNEILNLLSSRNISFGSVYKHEGNCHRINILGINQLIRDLKLNVLSKNKFIPKIYLRSSPQDRIDLLHGLMDGDGSITPTRNKVSYTSTSLELIEDLIELIEQLGGQCRKHVFDRRKEGKSIEYRLLIRIPSWVNNPFYISRKANRYNPGRNALPSRGIKSIKSVGIKESVCISVDSPDQLYVTEHCIVTHNTCQSLCSIPKGYAVLIICPAIAKEAVWAKDLERFRPEFKRTVLYGTGSFRWPEPGEVIITNYHILPDGEQIKKYPKWNIKPDRSMRMVAHRIYDIETQQLVTIPFEQPAPENLVIICDEVHNCFNLTTKRTRAFRAIMNAASKVNSYRWGLTGTELDSNPKQLWNLLTLFNLEKKAYNSWSNFLRIFKGTQTGFKKTKTGKIIKGGSIEWYVPKATDPPNKEAILGLQRVSIKRRLEDVVKEVPPMTIIDVPVEVDKATIDQCEFAVKELKDKYNLTIDQAIEVCMKTANGGIPFAEMAKANKMLAMAKSLHVVEYIKSYEDANEPILVFSMHVDPLNALAQRDGWRIITGKTSDKNRKIIVDDFQAGNFTKLGLSIKAAGLALNLDRSSFCFAIDFAYTPAANTQAWYRIRRFSQRRPQFVYRFIANHALDERKIELLDAREAIIKNTTEAAAIKYSDS